MHFLNRKTQVLDGIVYVGNGLTVPRPLEAVGLILPLPDRHRHTSGIRYTQNVIMQLALTVLPPQSQVGPGQYDITRWKRHQHSNGNNSVFISLTPRLPQRVDTPRELLLNERLHPKGKTYPTAAESLG